MAVISCPNCKKKISDKAKHCDHCAIDLVNLDEEKLRSIQHINTINASQRLMTHSFIAMMLFCGGFFFLYWSEPDAESWQYMTTMGAIAIGFFLYIVTRIRLILLKRSRKS